MNLSNRRETEIGATATPLLDFLEGTKQFLKLTTEADSNLHSLSHSQRTLLADLEQEAGTNIFQVIINETRIV